MVQGAKMARMILATVILLLSTNAAAATTCDEWATMVQVLVIRWQNDDQFQGKTGDDVKKELSRQMGGHPEIDTALKYVDYAYANRRENYQDVWKKTYDFCAATPI